MRRRDVLTRRQSEVLELYARGMNGKAIAAELFISPATVRNHVAAILERTGTHTMTAAVADHLTGKPLLTTGELIIELCRENGVAIRPTQAAALAEAFSCAHECAVHAPITTGSKP